MHILIVNSEYPPIGGGAGNASAHIARELVKMGKQVTVLTAGFAKLPGEEHDAGVRLLRLPGLRRKADRSTPAEQTIFMISAAVIGLFWAIRLKPTIVLAFFGVPSGAAVWFWNWFMKIPYIVCLRGGDVPGFRPYDFAGYHRTLSPLLRQVWRRAAAVVSNSAGLRDLGQNFEPNVDVQVIPNGVDLEKFRTDERSWTPAHMLFVGRIVYQKGLDLLLRALGNLQNREWTLSIVGDGPMRTALQISATSAGIGGRINFLGWKSRSELPAVFQQANLFVYPSRHEGMPNAVLEAMASGLPVIATRIAGNEDLVNDETGILVNSEDTAGLQVALEKIILDAQMRKQLGAAARKRVEKNYGWPRVAQEYLQLIKRALVR
jgi:glycosyltransferase involved in cell wall biosynthesis